MAELDEQLDGETESAERVYIRQAAEQLNRRMATLRKWEQQKILPRHLQAHRSQRGWRYWTKEQVEGIREWIRETDRRPGKGLPHYNPTELELDKAIEAMRGKRGQTGGFPRTPEVLMTKKKPARKQIAKKNPTRKSTRPRPGSRNGN